MKVKVGKKNYSVYAFDIESHNDPISIKRKETSMWLGCLINEKSKVTERNSYVFTMEEFLQKIELLSRKTRHNKNQNRPCANILIYVYNLSFEWSFILPVMLKMGFTFKESISKEDEYVYNTVSTKSVSSVWMINMKFGKNNGNIMFRDMSKIYSGGLATVAKSFNLPTQKGSINYRKYRLNKDYRASAKECQYCFDDTRILIDILLKLIENEDKIFFQISSMASYAMKELIKTGYPRATKPYKEFRKEYPVLDQDETNFLRKGVSGGITYAPEKFQFIDINQKIMHIDAHQMHPSQCYLRQFAYGKGTYKKGKPTNYYSHINCCRIRVSYVGVKLHSIIQLIGISFIENREITVWDFEIPTMYKCYRELKIEYIDYYEYKMKPLRWRKFYSNNYNKRLIAKANKDAFNTLRYKLLNNSSYGKLLEKPHNQIFINYIAPDGLIDSLVESKDVFNIEVGSKYTYLPVGSAIPAYSRVQLIETALLFGWEKICYFDTDSIFVLYDEDVQKVWDTKINKQDFLGGWGFEEFIDRAQFTAPKRYKTETDGITTIKAGGINFDEFKKKGVEEGFLHVEEGQSYKEALIPYDEVNIISSTWEVQRAYKVKGGSIIELQSKSMSVQSKYIEIYNKNVLK